MKKHILRMLCISFAAFLLFSSVFPTECFAATKKGPVIDVAVYPTEDDGYITVDIAFTENPGIGAMTFTLLYDHTTFATAPYKKRYFYEVPDTNIKKYYIVDHGGEGYVSIVWSPEGNDNLYTGTGVAFRLTFRINKKIPGKHPFEIGNIQPLSKGKDLTGCFSDFEHNTFTPSANNDAYVIGGDNNIPDSYPWNDNKPDPETPSDPAGEHTHNYVLHKKVAASCTADGYSIYECSVCGEKVTRDTVKALGHSFEDFWTVDRAASNTVTMKLSRHCSRCSAAKDVTYYTLDEVKEAGIKNSAGTKIYESTENGLEKTNTPDDSPDDVVEIVKVDPEKVTGAEELIGAAIEKEESKTTTGKVKKAYSFFEKLYMYLIGTKSRPGILRIIIRAIMKLFGK